MLVLGIAVGIAMLLPLVTRGSYSRLVMTPWRWGTVLFTGFALQVGLDWLPIPASRYDDVGYTLLVASYALVIAFCARNLLVKGMTVVLVGVACNALVITLNQGMPVDVPPDWRSGAWAEETVKHQPREPGDRLAFLGDVIVLRAPFDTVLSFGDLILAVGLCDVVFHASRRRARRTLAGGVARQRATSPAPATRADRGERLRPSSDRGAVVLDDARERLDERAVVHVGRR
jgi:hypothetical protein